MFINYIRYDDFFVIHIVNRKSIYWLQDSAKTIESIVTVDWENGFVETSAKENVNVSQVFKELLSQAKVKFYFFLLNFCNFVKCLKADLQWKYELAAS